MVFRAVQVDLDEDLLAAVPDSPFAAVTEREET
jgi:hypothetical protein